MISRDGVKLTDWVLAIKNGPDHDLQWEGIGDSMLARAQTRFPDYQTDSIIPMRNILFNATGRTF
jgi:hypothetical protein